MRRTSARGGARAAGLSHGKEDPEEAALPRGALELDAAAVLLDDVPRDGQTQSGPGRRILGGEECIENAFEAIRGYAVTVIGNDDVHCLLLVIDARFEFDTAVSRIARLHGLAGIE